jgi:hypothetical protein
VEVQEEVNRGGYLKFLDNCAVLTVEEGEIESEEIIENLQQLFFIINGIGSLGNWKNTSSWLDFLLKSKSQQL